MIRKLFISAAVFTSFFLNAQKQVDIKLNLRDGTTVSGTATMNDVVLKTSYGQLSVPIQNVSTIAVGIGKDKAITDKVLPYLKILNSSGSDDIKSGAYADLVKAGIKAIYAITEFQSDPKNNVEVELTGEYTIDNALAEIKSNFNIEDVSKVDDIIFIDTEYSMGGSYEFTKMDLKTEYGNLSIPKEKIKNIDISYSEPTNGDGIVLKLIANKHISGNQNGGWLKTGVTLKTGQKFSITASGEVTLASLSNQKYKPDGSYISSTGTSYPAAEATKDELYPASGVVYPSYGNVVYKIGEASMDVLKAGAKYSGVAKSNGALYLSIYETVYSASNTGSYIVKINLK